MALPKSAGLRVGVGRTLPMFPLRHHPAGEKSSAGAVSFSAAWGTEKRDKYPDNHDRGGAGMVRLADGTEAAYAVVADGCGGDSRGTKVAELAVARFLSALEQADRAILTSKEDRDDWALEWGMALQNEVMTGPLRGGNSTLAGAVLFREPGFSRGWNLVTVAVGDSKIFLFQGDELKCRGVLPDEPAERPNANDQGSLLRAIGLANIPGVPPLDTGLFPLPEDGAPYYVVALTDGVDSFILAQTPGVRRRVVKLQSMVPRDMAEVIALDGAVATLPERLLAASLQHARMRGTAALDNSTVAVVAVREHAGRMKKALKRLAAPSGVVVWWTNHVRDILDVGLAIAFLLVFCWWRGIF